MKSEAILIKKEKDIRIINQEEVLLELLVKKNLHKKWQERNITKDKCKDGFSLSVKNIIMQ